MEDQDILSFIVAMCDTGEATRYQVKQPDVAVKQFASDLAEQARERFGESREVLKKIKDQLKSYCDGTLKQKLNKTMGDGFVREVKNRYDGIYYWTIGTIRLYIAGDDGEPIEVGLQLKFGPSAWFANEKDKSWTHKVEGADYSRLFFTLTRQENKEVRQSKVTLQEVIHGLESTDHRLHDEIVSEIQGKRGLSG